MFIYTENIYENNRQGELLVQEKGGFNQNTTFYDTSFYMSDRLADFYDYMSRSSFLPLIADDKSYFFFNSKKHFNRLIKKVKAAKVNMIKSDYFVYDNTGVIIGSLRLILGTNEFNSKVELLASDRKRKSPVVQRLIKVRYSLVGNKLEQRLNLFELYKSTFSQRSMTKYLTINTVGAQDVPFEKSYSPLEYGKLKMHRRKKISDLANERRK